MSSLTRLRQNFEWNPLPCLPGNLKASRAGSLGAADMPAANVRRKAGA